MTADTLNKVEPAETKEVYLPTMHPEERKWGELIIPFVFTPSAAQAALDRWAWGGQRKIRESRVKSNVFMMEHGEWTERSEIHVGVLPDGTHHMLNGYHRLHALARCGPNTTMPVRLILIPVENEARLASIYSIIDKNGVRSYADDINAAGLAEEWGVTFETLKAASSAAALILTEFTGGRSNSAVSARGRSGQQRLMFIRDWRAEVTMADALVKLATKRMRYTLLRQPVLSVMLMTLRYQPEEAVAFWEQVASGENLFRGTAVKTLSDYLLGTNISAMHEHIYARYVANAWNAYRSNNPITRIQVKTTGLADPILIEGTPYNRTHRDQARQQRLEQERLRVVQRSSGQSSGAHLDEEHPDHEEKEAPLPEVQGNGQLLGAVPSLLRENFGPPPEHSGVEARGEQGGARP